MSDMIVDDGGGRQRKVPVDYPSNSKRQHKQQAERPKQEKIVTGNVVQRKPKARGRLAAMLINEDGPTVGQFILLELVVPAIKNLISDVISQGADRMLFGETRRVQNRPGGYINYSKSSTGVVRTTGPGYQMSQRGRATHDFGEMILPSRAQAEDVIDALRNNVDEYGVTSVSDLYDALGLTPEFTSEKWGWYDLKSASVRNVRDGYMLMLPRTVEID